VVFFIFWCSDSVVFFIFWCSEHKLVFISIRCITELILHSSNHDIQKQNPRF
jgi:hypothetical protein